MSRCHALQRGCHDSSLAVVMSQGCASHWTRGLAVQQLRLDVLSFASCKEHVSMPKKAITHIRVSAEKAGLRSSPVACSQ